MGVTKTWQKQPKFREIYILTLSKTWPEIEIFVMTSAASHHVTVWSEMQSTKKKFLSGVLLRLDGKNVLVQNRIPSPEANGK